MEKIKNKVCQWIDECTLLLILSPVFILLFTLGFILGSALPNNQETIDTPREDIRTIANQDSVDTLKNLIDIKAVIDFHRKRTGGLGSDVSRAYQGLHGCEDDTLSCVAYKDNFLQ